MQCLTLNRKRKKEKELKEWKMEFYILFELYAYHTIKRDTSKSFVKRQSTKEFPILTYKHLPRTIHQTPEPIIRLVRSPHRTSPVDQTSPTSTDFQSRLANLSGGLDKFVLNRLPESFTRFVRSKSSGPDKSDSPDSLTSQQL
jgi:hypothetical protein